MQEIETKAISGDWQTYGDRLREAREQDRELFIRMMNTAKMKKKFSSHELLMRFGYKDNLIC